MFKMNFRNKILLIAPEGIEIKNSTLFFFELNALLIAPEGIEMIYSLDICLHRFYS